jgi:hypothetical protein
LLSTIHRPNIFTLTNTTGTPTTPYYDLAKNLILKPTSKLMKETPGKHGTYLRKPQNPTLGGKKLI